MSDLISRQAAIERIMQAGKIGKLTCCDILRRLPPAQGWIPVKYRPMTEEERAYWLDRLWYDDWCELGDNMIFDCQMPDDGQKILVCSKCGNIWIDTNEDDGGLMGLEENGDWECIVAWMPLPEPFKEANNEQVQG